MNDMKNWRKKSLCDIADIISGVTQNNRSMYISNDSVPYVKITDLRNREIYYTETSIAKSDMTMKNIVPENAIMVSYTGTIGKVGIASRPVVTNQNIISFKFKNEYILDEFGYYYFVWLEKYLKTKATGSIISTLRKSDFYKLEVPIPPIEEQEYITRLLKEVENLKDIKKTAIIESEKYIPSLFIKMFGDPGLESFNYKFKSLKDVITEKLQTGLYKDHRYYRGDGISIIRADSFNSGDFIDVGSLKKINLEELEKQKYVLKEGDILINRMNSIKNIGKSTYICESYSEELVFESKLMRLKINHNMVIPEFMICWLNTTYVRDYIRKIARIAGNHVSINQKDVYTIPIPEIPIDDQRKFAHLYNKYQEIKKCLLYSKEKIDKLFTSMLEHLLTGKLRDSLGVENLNEGKYVTPVNKEVYQDKLKQRNIQELKHREKSSDISIIQVSDDKSFICIDNKMYFPKCSESGYPIEIPKEVLISIKVKDIPKDIGITEVKEIVGSGEPDYGALEVISIWNENGRFHGRIFEPYEIDLLEKDDSVKYEYDDFFYKVIELPNITDTDKNIIDAISSVKDSLILFRKLYYNRFNKVSIEAKNLISKLSRLQQIFFEEYLMAYSPLAAHTASKRVKLRLGSSESIFRAGVQEALRMVQLFEAFALLEMVQSKNIGYPESDLVFEENFDIQEEDKYVYINGEPIVVDSHRCILDREVQL